MNKNINKITIISSKNIEKDYIKDIFRYKELLFFFSLKEFLLRYKQAFFGILWAIIQPITSIFIFTFIFSGVANIKHEGNFPYFILVFAGIIPWQLISGVLPNMTNSLVTNSNLITKVYFPRILLPISTILTGLVDLIISLLIFLLILIFLNVEIISFKLLILPILIVFTIIFISSIGILSSALSVRFRDFKFLIPYLIQIMAFLSPVGYSFSTIPNDWKVFYAINPVVLIIEGFRWSLIKEYNGYNLIIFLPSFILTLLLFFIGLSYFRKTEKYFADRI